MRRHGLEPTIVPQKPFTTREILQALEPIDLTGKRTALVHYGERNTALADALRQRGAQLAEACPYEWALPEDIEPLRTVVRERERHVDALVFTSQVQVRHLFNVAEQLECGTS